jgi:isoamylase
VETRIDFYPTHEAAGFKLRPGKPYPFGATLVPNGVNFSIFSNHATACTLVLFEKRSETPLAEIPFFDSFRIGNVWCMTVFGLDYESIEYGFRMDGPWDPVSGMRFDKDAIMLDPYARAMGGRDKWGEEPDWNSKFPLRSRLVFEDFDWEDDRALEVPSEDLVIYETHVRSFTKHDSSGVKHPGTYAGIMEKIPYLKELGVNCVELMPVYEFDEFENSRPNPVTGETMYNYWGYSTVAFFAPKSGYAATGAFGMQVDEFKNLVKQLHKNGFEVILDVVFNHTAEGNEKGPTISFRGVDNSTYYMLTPEGYYFNFSGCGNTLNCNNPIVRGMVLDCLRYWASEFHIDGFRFDLAAILGRDPSGVPLSNPPLLETLAFDPILGKCKLIAEAWDAGGLDQLGTFPAYGRWSEWNGKFRDDLRMFLKGDEGKVGRLAQRVQGSPDLYGDDRRGPTASINFVTCHDGFTLYDSFAYDGKHNEMNGEGGNDGSDDNNSWNCGAEGDVDDESIMYLRHQQIRNALTVLMISHGIPMLLMGDEFGRTKNGNNNTYCHDNELNWLDWDLLKKNADLFRFAKNMIAFRHAHPVLRPRYHMQNKDYVGSGLSDISWHGTKAWNADWSESSKVLAFMLDGKHAKNGTVEDNTIYTALNTYWDALPFELPAPPQGQKWHVFVNTSMASPEDICEPGNEIELVDQGWITVGGRSSVVLVAK